MLMPFWPTKATLKPDCSHNVINSVKQTELVQNVIIHSKMRQNLVMMLMKTLYSTSNWARRPTNCWLGNKIFGLKQNGSPRHKNVKITTHKNTN